MSPRRNLVHLNAWRAFEAAARHSSFTLAAGELFVTPTAISHQIRQLEAYLGVQLFLRTKRGVVLTDAASRILPELSAAFDQLARSIARLRRRRATELVTITVPPSFAVKWLMTRLERFRVENPGLDVRIDTTDRLVDFDEDDVDLGVRYGEGDYPGLVVEKLLEEEVFPVCSPALARTIDESQGLDALRKVTLVHDTTIGFAASFPTWETWLAELSANDPQFDPSHGLYVNSSVLAIEAAVGGQGVILGRSVIVGDELRSGRLVRLFAPAARKGCDYYLVYPDGALEHERLRVFRDWICAEARR